MGRIVFWKALEISETKIIKPSANVMAMIMQREQMPVNGVYETVKPTPTSMNYPSSHVFTLKILFERLFLCLVVVKNLEMVH